MVIYKISINVKNKKIADNNSNLYLSFTLFAFAKPEKNTISQFTILKEIFFILKLKFM